MKMADHANQLHDVYQVSGKVMIFNNDCNKVLALWHDDGLITIPGGHIENDELPADAARRELNEELGIQYAGELRSTGYIQKYFPPKLAKMYSGQFRAGKLDIFFVAHIDEFEPLDVSGSGDRLSGYRWLLIADVIAGRAGDLPGWFSEAVAAVAKETGVVG